MPKTKTVKKLKARLRMHQQVLEYDRSQKKKNDSYQNQAKKFQ